MLKVKEIMTKEVKFLHLENTLEDIVNLLSQGSFSSVVIVNRDLIPIQIITIRDLVKIITMNLKQPTIQNILEHLEKSRENLITINQNKNLKIALNLMHQNNISHLPVVDNKQKLVGIISIRDLIKHLALLTFTDELTQVYNRKFLDIIKTKIINRNNICILMIDLDNFKLINDTYGHTVGDLVLKKTAKTIESSLRSSDIVIRYGGEEFLVILFRCFKDKLFDVAERIRNYIKQITLSKYPELKITVSIGGYFMEPEEDLYKAIEKADMALYKAKTSGKDCTIVF